MRVIVTLPNGHVPPEGEDREPQKRVVFGRRPTGTDLMKIAEDAQSQLDTNYELMLTAACITEFGGLQTPVPLGVLLALKRHDRRALLKGRNTYLEKSLGSRTVEALSDEGVRLAYGLQAGGQVYELVKFGNELTGLQEVEVEAKGFEGWRRVAALMALEIKQLAQPGEGGATFSGPFDLAMFEQADWLDLIAMGEARDRWINSFRVLDESVTVEDQEGGSGGRPVHGVDGAGDSGAPV